MIRVLVIFSLIAAASACAQQTSSVVATKPAPVGPDPAAVAQTISRAAEQVRGCYRSPKLNRTARQIVTVLHVTYTEDGNLAKSPVISRQSGVTEENGIYAPQMARAAIEAVERCVPLRLPPKLYKGGWDEFDLTFSPKGLA